MPTPPLSSRVVKKLSNACVRLPMEMPAPSPATLTRSVLPGRCASIVSRVAPWRAELSARCEKTISAFSAEMRSVPASRCALSPRARERRRAEALSDRRSGKDRRSVRFRLAPAPAAGAECRSCARRRRQYCPESAGAPPLHRRLAGASRSSRISSAAPVMAVSGDFCSCETCASKMARKSERRCSVCAMSRKLVGSAANSAVP